MRKKHNKSKGFSLIELLVVIAVIAVLTAIAVPMYSDYMLRAHRADAISTLNLIAMNEEAWMLDSGTYTASLSDVGVSSGGSVSARGFYSISLSGVTGSGYTIIATPIATQEADNGNCPNLTLVADNGIVTRTPAACWN
ncbi:type IV pilin protein [Caedibacter taeniospiralis]|uniref:type IV pilin protein n=1 Tax=Caedibacter taeniospiralis TaxID=28907 RepID=UPI0037C0DFBB